MKKIAIKLFLIVSIFQSSQSIAEAVDDPFISTFMFNQMELRNTDDGNPFVFAGQFWFGRDLNKLWIKTEFERNSGDIEEAEIQALYSKAIAPYWDVQMGIRSDLGVDSSPSRNWAVIGFQGLAPYFFEIDTAFFVGENGRTALRLEAEYEVLFTQKLILTPEIEVNIYGKDDPQTGVGSGLSSSEIGLRLRYEFRRNFAPYIGIVKTNTFNKTADYSRIEGQPVSDFQFVLGIRAWF